MIKIAIQNIHLAQNIYDVGIHNYILELVKQGFAPYLYFDGNSFKEKVHIYKRILGEKLLPFNIDNIEIIQSFSELNSKCDVLLNFNTYTKEHDFTENVKKFNGLKIWHVGDYFWNEEGSKINSRFEKFGIDYLFGYASHDKHCEYFKKTFPKYCGKVIPVPFGFRERFHKINSLSDRNNKCVALGSVNPLRPLQHNVNNYIESSNFYPDEAWFHKFRRMLVKNSQQLEKVMDSMLPIFPDIKDFKYDIVEKFNQYRMFVSCESIFNFPPAKSFEGPACGTALVCSDHECNKEYGFENGKNCIMYKQYDISDFSEKVSYYQKKTDKLKEIQKNGYDFVTKNYTHKKVASTIYEKILGLVNNN